MRVKPLVTFILIFFLIGVPGLVQFSRNTRSVDAIGLFFSGFACGAALIGLINALRGQAKTD